MGIEFIDCPVKNVGDTNMLKMMAEENKSDWSATPAVINEAVWAAKQFLDDLIDSYESLSAFKGSCGGKPPYTPANEGAFESLRRDGVGWGVVSAFLGKGWGEDTIKAALSALAEDAARAHSSRLARRAERAKVKEEAARLEAERLAKEESDKLAAQVEADRLAVEAAERDRLAQEAVEQAYCCPPWPPAWGCAWLRPRY